MTTSANVIEYSIFKGEEEVGRHSQNIMCSTCNDGLEKFQPYEDFTIQAWGYDEEEEMWENDKRENLKDWLIKHPASFTFKPFEVGDVVKLTKRRGEGKIIECSKGRFMPVYIVETQEGEKISIYQGDIIPNRLV